MQLSTYKKLGILPNQSQKQNFFSLSDFLQIEENLEVLLFEIDEMANYMDRLQIEKKETKFYFDFDVIYSTIDWLSSIGRDDLNIKDSVWSSLATLQYCTDSSILPGTAAEIVGLLIKRQGIRKTISKERPLFESFIKAFYNSSQLQSHTFELFFNSIKALSSVDFDSHADYVFRKIFSSKEIIKLNFDDMTYDHDLFHQTFQILSTIPKREDRHHNNKADAINFSICNKKNQYDKEFHHILISNTRALQELRIFPSTASSHKKRNFSRLEVENGVSSPRQACMFKLLLDYTGADISVASDLAFQWREDVAKDLRLVRRKIRDSSEKTKLSLSELFETDALTEIIWISEYIEEVIESSKKDHKKKLTIFKETFDPNDQRRFTDFLINLFKNKITNSRHADIMSSFIRVDTLRDREDIKELFGTVCEISTGRRKFCVAGAENGLRIWGDIAPSYQDFVDRVNKLKNALAKNFFVGNYTNSLEFGDISELDSIGSWQLRQGVDRYAISNGILTSVAFGDLLEKAKLEKKSVRKISYDCPFFFASFDGEKTTFTTDKNVSEEVLEVFLFGTDFIAPRNDEEKMYSAIESCISYASLESLR